MSRFLFSFDDASQSNLGLLLRAYLHSALGIAAGLFLFPREASLIAVFLLALSSSPVLEGLLNRNREQIWQEKMDPRVANMRLAWSILAIFLGVFIAYLFAVQLSPFARLELFFKRQLGAFASASLAEVHFGSFVDLFERNLGVLLACFCFALLYRHGGMLLVLGWNASRWGVIFSYLARVASEVRRESEVEALGRILVCILPHLLLEAVAYVLVAMAGVFLARALARYSLGSPEFARVGRAVLTLAAVSVVVLAAAAGVEAHFAPAMVRWVG